MIGKEGHVFKTVLIPYSRRIQERWRLCLQQKNWRSL